MKVYKNFPLSIQSALGIMLKYMYAFWDPERQLHVVQSLSVNTVCDVLDNYPVASIPVNNDMVVRDLISWNG